MIDALILSLYFLLASFYLFITKSAHKEKTMFALVINKDVMVAQRCDANGDNTNPIRLLAVHVVIKN